MREQFEKLPEIANSLSQHIYFGDDNLYHSDLINFQKLVCWINGAWYAFQEQQAIINDLKAQLECCRKENAVLLGKLGGGEKRVGELSQWNSNQYELIKRNESHTQSLRHLLQKLVDDDYTTMRPSMAFEIQKTLRGEHEKI